MALHQRISREQLAGGRSVKQPDLVQLTWSYTALHATRQRVRAFSRYTGLRSICGRCTASRGTDNVRLDDTQYLPARCRRPYPRLENSMGHTNRTGKLIKTVGMLCALSLTLFATSGCEKQQKGESGTAQKTADAPQETRVSFDQLFDVSGNIVTPKRIIRYAGKTFTPEVPFEVNAVTIDGTPFSQLIGHDAEIKKTGDVTEIIKFH